MNVYVIFIRTRAKKQPRKQKPKRKQASAKTRIPEEETENNLQAAEAKPQCWFEVNTQVVA